MHITVFDRRTGAVSKTLDMDDLANLDPAASKVLMASIPRTIRDKFIRKVAVSLGHYMDGCETATTDAERTALLANLRRDLSD